MNVLIFYPSGNNSNVTQPVSYSPCWRRYRSILSTAVPKTMPVFIWSFFLLDVIRSSAEASAAARFVVNWKLDRCSRRQKLWDAHSTRVSNFANGNTSSIAAILFYFAFCNTCNNLYWFFFFFMQAYCTLQQCSYPLRFCTFCHVRNTSLFLSGFHGIGQHKVVCYCEAEEKCIRGFSNVLHIKKNFFKCGVDFYCKLSWYIVCRRSSCGWFFKHGGFLLFFSKTEAWSDWMERAHVSVNF